MRSVSLIAILIACLTYGFTFQTQKTPPPPPPADLIKLTAAVSEIFQQSCATSGCHHGQYPKKQLNLETEKFMIALVEVASKQIDSLKLVDKTSPQKSYLLMKVRGDKGILEDRMPINAPPLTGEELKTIEKWLNSLAAAEAFKIKKGIPPPPPDSKKKNDQINHDSESQYQKSGFWGTHILNLPTVRTIGKNDVLFRISHRYYPTVTSGYETYFGINGPAVILVSFCYGLTEHLSLTLGHTNQLHAWELAAKWNVIEAGQFTHLPLSASMAGGVSWITQEQPNQATLRSENFKYHAQLIVEYQVNHTLAFTLTPGFATTSEYWQGTTQGTFTLGSGVHVNFWRNLALISEWTPVLCGYRPAYAGLGLGLEAKTGGHVFQIFVTNSLGMLVDQYLPGGDLNYRNNDYRFGFNIFRTFWF